jgi:hypothetical protein
MPAVFLGAKAALAVMLVLAGAAKFADLGGFGSTVRLFLPPAIGARNWSARAIGVIAAGVAGGELILGGASLSSPAVAWLNLAVFGATCAFVVVSGAGYAFHRGRSCSCFGGLSHRRFDRAGILRAVVIAGVAGLGTAAVPGPSTRLDLTDRFLLLAAAALLAGVAVSAARGLAAGRLEAAGRTS